MERKFEDLVICRNPGKTVPQSYLEKILPKYQSVAGMAMVSEDDTSAWLSVENFPQAATLDAFQHVQSGQPDKTLLFQIGQYPEKYHTDDIFPQVLLTDGQDRPVMVVFMQGSFSRFHNAKSEHSDAFFAYLNYLRPKIRALSDSLDGDVEEVMKKIKTDPLLRSDIEGMGAGTVTFFAANGEFVTLGTVKFGGDWGWATEDHGWTDQPSLFGGAMKAVKKTFASATKKPAAETSPSPPPSPSPQPSPAQPEPGKKEGAPPAPPVQPTPPPPAEQPSVAATIKIRLKAPASAKHKNQKRDFFVPLLGFCPEGYKKEGTVYETTLDKLAIKDFATLAKLPEGVTLSDPASAPLLAGLLKPASATAIPKDAGKPKDTAPHHVGQKTDNSGAASKQDETDAKAAGTLTANDKIGVETWAKKHKVALTALDNNGEEIIHPSTYQDMEKRTVKFSEQMGIQGGLYNWLVPIDPQKRQELCYEVPDSANLIIGELVLEIAQLRAEKGHKGTQTPTVPAVPQQTQKKKSFAAAGRVAM